MTEPSGVKDRMDWVLEESENWLVDEPDLLPGAHELAEYVRTLSPPASFPVPQDCARECQSVPWGFKTSGVVVKLGCILEGVPWVEEARV